MNRRAFLKAGSGVAAFLLTPPLWSAETDEQADATEEVLQQARRSIERHRQSEAVVMLHTPDGKPVAGAKVAIEQRSHEFLFGCNFFGFGRCGEPNREEAYRESFATLFNYCTLGFYWAGYEAEPSRPHYDYTEQVVDWTSAHGIASKGHPLVWDHPASSPRWLPEEFPEIERLVRARVKEIVSRFQGRIDIWDVVNEATHLSDEVNKTRMARWGAAIGPVKYAGEPLKIARSANPKARLVINDYRTDPPYYRLLAALREQERPLFDVVGIQSHMHAGSWPPTKVREVCDVYARLGRPLHFTETTILSGPPKRPSGKWEPTTPEGETSQAKLAANFYTTLFAHPAVQAITWWDFSDYLAWQGAPAGLVRSDMSPKPVYERLLALIKGEWWTKHHDRTDARGEFKLKAFYGKHRLKIELANGQPSTRQIQWQRDQPKRIEITV